MNPVDFGAVPQGGRRQAVITLTNSTSMPVAITAIEQSCDCLAVSLDSRIVSPASSVTATVHLDLTPQPNFTGALEMRVRGRTDAAETAFVVRVMANVKGGGS